MRVPSSDTKSVVDNHQAAIACVRLGNRNYAVGRGMNRRAVVGSHVYAGVEGAFSAKRIESFTEAIRDVAHYRPNGRRIAGVGKVCGEQMQSAAGDYRGVAFQESVLLHRAVKSILRVSWVVRLIKRRWVIPQHAVGHGHFGRERLQGIEALIGIVDGSLQLAVLLSPGL